MILQALCEIKQNVIVENYYAVEGTNVLLLIDDDNEIARYKSNVLWCGKGSPFPTPPGGPWSTDYVANHPRLGKCFFVHSDMESEIFIHFAAKKSYGCFIINPTVEGNEFMEKLIEHQNGLKVVQLQPVDNRRDAEKSANPIYYEKIGRVG